MLWCKWYNNNSFTVVQQQLFSDAVVQQQLFRDAVVQQENSLEMLWCNAVVQQQTTATTTL